MKINTTKIIYSVLFTAIFLMSGIKANSQISGISNSKVFVISPDVVGNKLLEFEPAFLYSYSDNYWNGSSETTSINGNKSNRISSVDFGMRLTYGAFENFEIGTVIPTDMSAVSLGAKYKFFSNDRFDFAGFLGINFYNDTFMAFDKDAEGVNPIESGLGIVGKYNFNENLSVDLDAQYLSNIIRGEDTHNGNLFINSELGYYAGDYQFCAGFNYYNSLYETEEQGRELLSLMLGGTVETAEDFVIIWGVPYDLYGKNIEQSLGFTLAFTITIK